MPSPIPSGYVIGVSSGTFTHAQRTEQESYITTLRKAMFGATKGVNFTQIDLESITEFKEPFIKEEIARIKELGMSFGYHGEFTRQTLMLDSAIEGDYARSHERLIMHVEGAGELGAVYVNVHASESTPFPLLYREFQASSLVDFWGRPLSKLLDENPALLEWAIGQDVIMDVAERHYRVSSEESLVADMEEKFTMRSGHPPDEKELAEIRKNAKDHVKKQSVAALKHYISAGTPTYGPERIAYWLVGKLMKDNNDPLWASIVSSNFKEESFFDQMKSREWVPAVTAKYVWGHFNPQDTKRYPDPKPLLAKYNMIWLFESEMAQAGFEMHMRLNRIPHIYYLAKNCGPNTGVCIDFEHLLSAGYDPKKEIADLPEKAGDKIMALHVGWPTPHIPAHMPIYVGSEAQLYLYERMFELRQKGWRRGYVVFERAGPLASGDPVMETVLSLRKIVHYLEKDMAPGKLPLDFFGLDKEGPEIARQRVSMREHYLEPLKGMLKVPEEEFSMLSKAAAGEGKAEEWKKRKLR